MRRLTGWLTRDGYLMSASFVFSLFSVFRKGLTLRFGSEQQHQ
jgi:hypothetical protein